MHAADVLSRKPVGDVTLSLIKGIEEYELLSVKQLPTSEHMLSRIKEELKKDLTTALVMYYSDKLAKSRNLGASSVKACERG